MTETLTSMFNLIPLAAEAAAGAGGDKGEKLFPPFDPTYYASQAFWLLVTFFTLYFLLSKVLLPMVGGTIEERSSRIADDLDAASRMQREAEEAEKSYEQALKDARAKAHSVSEATRQSVDAEISREMEAAEADAARQADAAEARIRDVRTAALANIESVAAEAAQATVSALTGKTVPMAKVKAALN